MNNLDVGIVKDLTELAIHYGPFFFSIFFLLIILRWGQKKYRKAVERTDQPAKDREKNTYRWIFIGSAISAILLVITSMIWWFYDQREPKIIQGVIQNVGDYIDISSPELYTRVQDIMDQPLKDIHFIYLYESTDKDQDIRLFIQKEGRSRREPINIKCPHKQEILKYQYSFDGDHNVQLIANNPEIPRHYFLNPVFASGNPASAIHFLTSFRNINPPLITTHFQDEINLNWIESLQSERVSVGEKIDLLDSLSSIQNINDYLYYVSPKEPFILTMLDLRRHSDPELSYKAIQILNPVSAKEILSILISNNHNSQEAAHELMPRLDHELAFAVVDFSRQNSQLAWINEFEDYGVDKSQKQMLYPTGSLDGDRYYVKATWDKQDISTKECLTVMFNNELISSRSLQEERKIMNSRDYRIVYWYSKEWALNIAKKIEECGGKSEFIQYSSQKSKY